MSKQLPSEPGETLRDRFFALSTGTPSEAERRRFRARVDSTQVEPVLELDGLGVSYHPSARFKALRFVEAERIPEPLRAAFARPSAQMPELAAVFVDPEELCYRNFENILPLDRWFARRDLQLELSERRRLGSGHEPTAYMFTLTASDQARAALTELDGLGLYLDPQNPESRGGKRFIFHAARLAEALTVAVEAALPKRWAAGFVHVNPVFRCNRFEPGDHKFRRHLDTPYYDAARDHVSRYTMLIYLTGGRGEPALAIADDVELERIEALTCVVFRQDLEYEGSAYVDGRKLFLRTELIFEDASVDHDPAIARTFAQACYMTGESVFAPELARATHDLYERAAAAHWRGPAELDQASEPYLHKQFRGIDFVTNGYDFWFAKRSLSLRECAAIALLDVLNCKIAGQAFRKLCTTEILRETRPPGAWVDELLHERSHAPAEPLFAALDRRPYYLDVEVTVDAPHLLVPPILFVETELGHHLMLDLFRNSWMVSHRPRAIPIPRLRELAPFEVEEDELEPGAWMDVAELLVGSRGEDEDQDDRAGQRHEPWWASASPLVRELYPESDD